MRQPILILCAAALLSSLSCGQIGANAFAGRVLAAHSDSGRPFLLDDRNGGSVVNLGGFVEGGARDVFDKSDVWSQPRGIDAELNGDGGQIFAQADDWDDWVERQALNLPGVKEAAGSEGEKWTFILITFVGLTAALSGRAGREER